MFYFKKGHFVMDPFSRTAYTSKLNLVSTNQKKFQKNPIIFHSLHHMRWPTLVAAKIYERTVCNVLKD